MTDLMTLLKDRFDPARAGELDATVEFSWPHGCCRVGVHEGDAVFYEDPQSAPEPELVLYFPNEERAVEIFSGRKNPVEAFMQGEFRSNGYLVWAFQSLAAFSRRQPD